MQPSDFIHPEDAAALRQMENIPGFAALIKNILAIGLENLQYSINMASAIRLSERLLLEIYRHLPPICEKMGISEREFYLQGTLGPLFNMHSSIGIGKVKSAAKLSSARKTE